MSGYYIADVLLALDKCFVGKLLVTEEIASKDPEVDADDILMLKMKMALGEGKKLKRIMGYLRYLFRNSKHGAKSKKVRSLKCMLMSKDPK